MNTTTLRLPSASFRATKRTGLTPAIIRGVRDITIVTIAVLIGVGGFFAPDVTWYLVST